MPSYTENHQLSKWAEGELDWQHRDDMDKLDRAVEIRDLDANKGDYTPKDGAKFIATDTHAVYLGDGSSWNAITYKPTQDHIDDATNPHSVSNDQVNAPSQTEFDTHTGDTSNPHSVTATQANALPDSGGTVTGDIDLNGANRLVNIAPETEGLWWELDSSTSGQYWGKVQFTDANGDDIYWTSNRDAGDALKVVNTTTGVTRPLFHVSDAGQVSVGEGSLSIAGGEILGQRGAPTTSELDSGERMQYVSDGSDGNDAGDLVSARNDSGTIVSQVISQATNDT